LCNFWEYGNENLKGSGFTNDARPMVELD